VRLAQAGFADPLRIFLGGNVVFDDLALNASEAKASIVELKFAFGVDQACVHGRQGTKEFDLVFVIIESSFEKAEVRSAICFAAAARQGATKGNLRIRRDLARIRMPPQNLILYVSPNQQM